MKKSVQRRFATAILAVASLHAHADAVTDWNTQASRIIAQAKLGTPPAIRVMAMVQTAAFEAANAVTRRYPGGGVRSEDAKGASVDAAIAAAHRTILARLLPDQQAGIDAAYEAALSRIADDPSKIAGIRVGERAAQAVRAARAGDMVAGQEDYRPHAVPAVYVPTATPAVPQWSQRKPWLLARASQFRPAPPPALSSSTWARDYNEVKELGGKSSTRRTDAQTQIARFWEFSLPAIYYGVVHSVAGQPGRDVTRNARLFAAVAQAMDDAMIAVFEAKYHYRFWRPTTAIRNGDLDGNPSTERAPSWTPFIDVPMHPEYPSAHAILASAVGEVLRTEAGNGGEVNLATASPTAGGTERRWSSIDAFLQEVVDGRVYEGVHFRFSSETGAAMGREIGSLAVRRFGGS